MLKWNTMRRTANMTSKIIVNDTVVDPEKIQKLTEQANCIRKFRGGNNKYEKEKEGDQ